MTIRLKEPNPDVFRGSADEPLVWRFYGFPQRGPRWWELLHYLHVHHDGECLKNRFGPKCEKEESQCSTKS